MGRYKRNRKIKFLPTIRWRDIVEMNWDHIEIKIHSDPKDIDQWLQNFRCGIVIMGTHND